MQHPKLDFQTVQIKMSEQVQDSSDIMDIIQQGAEDTRKMTARCGRASYVSPEHLTQPDPGAVAVTVWLQAVYTALCKDHFSI